MVELAVGGSAGKKPVLWTLQCPWYICFGVFEIDRQAGEVCKSGIKPSLQVSLGLVLVTLLEGLGGVVTRRRFARGGRELPGGLGVSVGGPVPPTPRDTSFLFET